FRGPPPGAPFGGGPAGGRPAPRLTVDVHTHDAIDRHDERRGAAKHGPFAGEEELPRRGRVDHGRTSTPPPGAHTSTRDTPGTSRSASATRGASVASHSTFTCGPASIVT